MKKIDILFLHTGKTIFPNKEIINLIPIGLPYLADFLQKNNINAKIINLSLLSPKTKMCSLFKIIEEHDIRLIGLPLHWHQQSFNVINTSKQIKARFPSINILLGGNTSSLFYSEIMKQFSFIDFIIRGDSEIPILKLCEEILKKKNNFKDVPNLAWRNNNKIIANKQTYISSSKILKQLNFNPEVFMHHNGIFVNAPLEFGTDKMLIYNPFRGCPGQCPYCGGGRLAQGLIFKRKDTLEPNVENEFCNLQIIKQLAPKLLFLPHSIPSTHNFYLQLFKQMRKIKLSLNASLQSYYLPEDSFIKQFAQTFKENSIIVISPETGSDSLRKKIKTFYYSNNDLIKKLELLVKLKIKSHLTFATGFPWESEKDFARTILFIKYLKNRFPVTMEGGYIELEPASLMHLNPGKFNIFLKRKTFIDFLYASRQETSLGYHTSNFTENQIIENARILKTAYEK